CRAVPAGVCERAEGLPRGCGRAGGEPITGTRQRDESAPGGGLRGIAAERRAGAALTPQIVQPPAARDGRDSEIGEPRYRLLRNLTRAAFVSSGFSCCVQWPAPGMR